MLVTKPHSKEELRVLKTLSMSLGLPEFHILNQMMNKDCYIAEVERESHAERCPYCGFLTHFIYDHRTRVVRDL